MAEAAPQLETLLRRALAPVEPPADLAVRVERTLTDLHSLASEELESWELSSMRDPRNWARPAAAVVVGTGAGAALVVLRTRQRATQRQGKGRGKKGLTAALLEVDRTARDLREEARRILRPRG
jgi:hypothetical protein